MTGLFVPSFFPTKNTGAMVGHLVVHWVIILVSSIPVSTPLGFILLLDLSGRVLPVGVVWHFLPDLVWNHTQDNVVDILTW